MSSPALPSLSETCFSWRLRVYYEDTDAGGIVYHASYVRWMERARTEWLRNLGWTRLDLIDQAGVQFVVRALNIAYRRPARLDDAIRVDVSLLEIKRASLRLRQVCWLDDATPAHLCTEAEVQLAVVSCASGHPQALPPALLQSLRAA